MIRVIELQGTEAGRVFGVDGDEMLFGRSAEADVRLEGVKVSRRHARISQVVNQYFIEDLGSRNGTYLNGALLQGRSELRAQDQVQIGPYVYRFESEGTRGGDVTILAQADAVLRNTTIFQDNAAVKLQAVIELSQHLSRATSLEELFQQLLDHLLQLFPQADRALVILSEGEQLIIRASKARSVTRGEGPAFSNTVVTRVMNNRRGVAAEDASADSRFQGAATLMALGIRSFLCVPLALASDKVLGAIQIDRTGAGRPFKTEDLNLLTAIALQVAAIVENAQLHEKLVDKARIERDLVLARQIQDGLLPRDPPVVPGGPAELYATVIPAFEVAGDFYDYFIDDHGRLAFVVADVSGKGMPAALFMTMCRSLLRHLAPSASSPAHALERLNEAVSNDNPTMMFVTLVYGTYQPGAGELTLSSAGHPPGFLRRRTGQVEAIHFTSGSLVGYGPPKKAFTNTTLRLEPGDALTLYTDGITEAAGAENGGRLFGEDGLAAFLTRMDPAARLDQWSRRIHQEITAYAGNRPLDDDLTLLFVRRPEG